MEEAEGLTGPVAPALTAQEEAFLRSYSETLDRMAALQEAGLRPHNVGSIDTQQHLMSTAGTIIAKAERMSLSSIASAMGKDRIYLLHHIARVVESNELHEAIKGLQLMARVHGLWDKDVTLSRRQVALIFGAPIEKPEPRRANLPFVIEAEYEDIENEPPNKG